MGRKAKSTKLKIIEGNPGKRKLPDEPKPRPIAPKLPKDLSKEARKVWRKFAPKLEHIGLLTEVDEVAFIEFCEIAAQCDWIKRQLNWGDLDEKQRAFMMKEHRLYANLLKSYASEFGLTPNSRRGLGITIDEEMSEFEKLLD